MTQLGKVKGTFNKKQAGQTLAKINNKMMREFNPLLLMTIAKCTKLVMIGLLFYQSRSGSLQICVCVKK